MDYDDLQQAFLAYRRANGSEAAITLMLKHGADKEHPTLDSVPEDRWPPLRAAFKANAPREHVATAGWPKLTSVSDLDAKAIFARWNGARAPAQEAEDA